MERKKGDRMNKNKVLDKIIECIGAVKNERFDISVISETTNLVKDLDFDSFELIQLIVAMENEFLISFDFWELNPDELASVKKLSELVIKRCGVTNEC